MAEDQSEGGVKLTTSNILLYPFNLVGYGRLAMLTMAVVTVYLYTFMGWAIGSGLRWGIAVWLFICLLILDVVDGYLARQLGHVTNFGAVFELTIDLLTHTFVWVLSGLTLAPLIIGIEWIAGLLVAIFIRQPAHHWKTTLVQEGPWLVRFYFQPLRLNLLNVYSNLAHFIFPISLFVVGLVTWFSYLMLPGLLVFEVVTIYMIYTFIKILVVEDEAGTV